MFQSSQPLFDVAEMLEDAEINDLNKVILRGIHGLDCSSNEPLSVPSNAFVMSRCISAVLESQIQLSSTTSVITCQGRVFVCFPRS